MMDGNAMRFDPPSGETLDRAAGLVLSACRAAFADSLECVTLKGSAVRGDFIRGYSDFDFHVFLGPDAMDGERVPRLEGAVRFQKAFGDIDPEDFGASQIQIYFIDSQKYPADWVPPVEGTYRIFYGKLPSAARERSDSTYVHFAEQSLSTVGDSGKKIVERFVDKPNSRVSPVVRLLGATLKGYMYSVAVLLTSEPKAALRLKLDELALHVERGIGSEGHFSTFFEHVSNWLLVQQDHDYAREAFEEGVKALDEINCWLEK